MDGPCQDASPPSTLLDFDLLETSNCLASFEALSLIGIWWMMVLPSETMPSICEGTEVSVEHGFPVNMAGKLTFSVWAKTYRRHKPTISETKLTRVICGTLPNQERRHGSYPTNTAVKWRQLIVETQFSPTFHVITTLLRKSMCNNGIWAWCTLR